MTARLAAHAIEAARDDHDSVLELARDLVRIPSRAGADPYGPVLDCMSRWLAGHGLTPRRLAGPDGQVVALVCEVPGGRPGPRYVLDACLGIGARRRPVRACQLRGLRAHPPFRRPHQPGLAREPAASGARRRRARAGAVASDPGAGLPERDLQLAVLVLLRPVHAAVGQPCAFEMVHR